jgi:hypothetical protein
MKYEEALSWVASALEDYLRTLPVSARDPAAKHARFAMQVVMDEAKRPVDMPAEHVADNAAQRGAWAEDDVKAGGTD